MFRSIHFFEISIFEKLQYIRNSFLDDVFKSLNFFDTLNFFIILIPIVFFGFYWKSGIRILMVLLLNWALNIFFKEVFSQPRPEIDSSYILIIVRGYGFPSGAAQTSLLLGCIFIRTWRKYWAWVIGLNYIIWISFSRIYLGVHYPSDIIGGFVIGLIVFSVYVWLFPIFEKKIKKNPVPFLVFLGVIFPIIVFFTLDSSEKIRIIFLSFSAALGLFLSWKYNLFLPHSKNWKEGLIRSFYGVVSVVILFFIIKYLLSFESWKKITTLRNMVESLMLGLWLTFLANYVYRKILIRCENKLK
jgi:undecaprenyl-diphosphatase